MIPGDGPNFFRMTEGKLKTGGAAFEYTEKVPEGTLHEPESTTTRYIDHPDPSWREVASPAWLAMMFGHDHEAIRKLREEHRAKFQMLGGPKDAATLAGLGKARTLRRKFRPFPPRFFPLFWLQLKALGRWFHNQFFPLVEAEAD